MCLKYEVLGKVKDFRNDEINLQSGILIIKISKGSLYFNVAISIINIILPTYLYKTKNIKSKLTI